MTLRASLIVLSGLLIGGCLSEMNKPIRPNDPWRAKAEAMNQPMGMD